MKPIVSAPAQNVTAIKKPDDKQLLQLEDAPPATSDDNNTLIIGQDFVKVPAEKATWKPKPGMLSSAFSWMKNLVHKYYQ